MVFFEQALAVGERQQPMLSLGARCANASARRRPRCKYKGRKPTARRKVEDAVCLYRDGKRVAHIAAGCVAR